MCHLYFSFDDDHENGVLIYADLTLGKSFSVALGHLSKDTLWILVKLTIIVKECIVVLCLETGSGRRFPCNLLVQSHFLVQVFKGIFDPVLGKYAKDNVYLWN